MTRSCEGRLVRTGYAISREYGAGTVVLVLGENKMEGFDGWTWVQFPCGKQMMLSSSSLDPLE
jgi:hypothetical protein